MIFLTLILSCGFKEFNVNKKSWWRNEASKAIQNPDIEGSEDILKNISDSTSPDYIGAFPSKSDLINNGEACSIEGEFDLSCQNTAN